MYRTRLSNLSSWLTSAQRKPIVIRGALHSIKQALSLLNKARISHCVMSSAAIGRRAP